MIISTFCRRLKAEHVSSEKFHWVDVTPIDLLGKEQQTVTFHLQGPLAAERAAYIAAAINAANEMGEIHEQA